MSFYSVLSQYYEQVFPLKETTLQFLKRNIPGSDVLDVACGDGAYAIRLGSEGYRVIGVDLDEAMIQKAIQKSEPLDLNDCQFRHGNMLQLESSIGEKVFSQIVCIGNSLVHLDDLSQVKAFIKQSYNHLTMEGRLVIQIINFDRVLEHQVTALPTIKHRNPSVEFVRRYEYDEVHHKILFKTVLITPEGTYEHQVPLFPMTYEALASCLKDVGFKRWNVYGGFDQSEYQPSTSYGLVVEAFKS